MVKKEAKELSEIFGSDTFNFGGLKPDLVIKIVRIQIVVDTAAEAINKAIKTAIKSLVTPRLKELSEKAQTGKLLKGTQEAIEFTELNSSFEEKLKKAIEPISNEKIEISIQLSEDEFKDLCLANSFKGSMPVTIYKLLVAHNKQL